MTPLEPGQGLALVTDGSANWKDRSGGWAWIALDAWEGIECGSGYCCDTTSNQMELHAAIQGLDYLSETYGACQVLIYSDSQYLVKGAVATTGWRKKNQRFWKALDLAMERHQCVSLTHVKGHSGHLWNEMADETAKKARRSKGAK